MLNGLSGKEKAARVPLDYFRKAGRGRVKITLALLGLVLVIMGVSFASGGWRQLALPGKVHHAHASFEDRCASCHAPFQPSTSGNPLQSILQTGPVADHLCKACHDGPPHHPGREIAGDPTRCVHCHVEHRGRSAPISRVADRNCTVCHGALPAHALEAKTSFESAITHFTNHPQFRVGAGQERKPLHEAQDPGKIRFNHQIHLSEGLRHGATDSRGWKLRDISDQGLREIYRKQQASDKKADDDFVQLNCASCHNTDASDALHPGNSRGGLLIAGGEYMLPISYERHCKACHTLTFPGGSPEQSIPHGLQPAEVNKFLWGALLEKTAHAEKKAPDPAPKTSSRPLPGDNLGRLDRKAKVAVQAGVAELESQLYETERSNAVCQVYLGKNTCGLCHFEERQAGKTIPEKILPANLTEIWYPHSRFNHMPHRALHCLECHPQAATSTTQLDLLVPGIDNCKICHGPLTQSGGMRSGGVPHECTTCHLYHNRDKDNPFAGVGSAARGLKERKTVLEFLNPK